MVRIGIRAVRLRSFDPGCLRRRLASASIGAAGLATAAMLLTPQALAQTTADANVARSLAATCANCHGTDGRAQGVMVPLAGYPSDRLIATFNDFRSGKRPATIMHQISKGYTDAQVRLIAGYFAAQPAK